MIHVALSRFVLPEPASSKLDALTIPFIVTNSPGLHVLTRSSAISHSMVRGIRPDSKSRGSVITSCNLIQRKLLLKFMFKDLNKKKERFLKKSVKFTLIFANRHFS